MEAVNYEEFFEDKEFPCPLCQTKRDIRISEKGKPYLVCDECGVQLFIRKHEGIERLKEAITTWFNKKLF